MLQLYTYIQAIGKHIARAQVIAELERRRQLRAIKKPRLWTRLLSK